MPPTNKSLRLCPKGHRYYKSSDCPTCPKCEAEKKPTSGFLSLLSAPARRALEAKGVNTLKQLSKYSESEILSWHGIGPNAFSKLKKMMEENKLSFKSLKKSK